MSRSSGRASVIPVVYGGVVLLLIVLGVLAHGFTRDIGDARLAGRYATLPLFQSRTVRDLTVSWNGLSLRFSTATTPSLLTVESTTDGGTDLVFEGDVRLHLAPGRDTGGSVSLAAVPGSGRGQTLVVPFAVAGVLLAQSPQAALSWNRAGRSYVLALPTSAQVDVAARVLRLPLGGTAWSAALKQAGTTAIAAAAPVVPPSAATRLPDAKLMPSEDQLAASMKPFIDGAYAGWSQTRIGAAGTWKLPDGTVGFSEDIGIALLAESIARGTWQRDLALWSDALAAQQASDSALSLTTSTYVGGVRDYARLLQTRAAAQIDALRPLLSASDTKALATPSLIRLVTDHGDAEILQAGITFVTTRSAASLDVRSAVGLLDALVDDAVIFGGNGGVAKAMTDVVEKKILPSLRSSGDSGVFLDTGNGRADVKEGMRAGSLLLAAGAALSDPRLSAYGRGLLASGIGLADSSGMLPAALTIASGKISKKEGQLGPESIYPFLPLDRRMAREIPLTRQLGQGAWIWTSARVVSAESTSSQTTLVLAYPAGIAHNVVLQGIRPFSMVKLHGIPWHTDPTYYKYSDGWSYDSTTRTFYLKVTGRAEQEEIDIVY